ncbi:MAG: site-specific DNA-methyltransferase [Fibrobacteres bacterium]|nr:site-specific DNA-methyltransferase [Fibrobacterota bacterium]
MQTLTAGSPESQSANLKAANIAALRALFPELVTERIVDGKTESALNVEVLMQLVGGATVLDSDEKYGLNWHGKRRARQLALTPSTGTLRPAPGESVDWDTTQNLMIEGDNLEVLKLLQKSYAGKVKLIYIDPPYNTGNDFVYPDNFQDNIKNYLELTGQTGEGGAKLSSNTEASGRFHTDWLNMIYPRLKLAHSLLRNDGVILLSIDDAEQADLKQVCDEIYGQENFLAHLVWDRNRKNDAKYFSVGHEYMLVYAKNERFLTESQIVFRGQKEGIEEVKVEFDRLSSIHEKNWELIKSGLQNYYRTIPDDDPKAPLKRFTKVDDKGPYRDDGNINWPGGGGPTYEILHPVSMLPCKLPVSGWRFPSPERFWEEFNKGRVVFGPDEKTVPRIRTNLFESTDQVLGSVTYSYAQTAANEFNAIFDGVRVFDNPKPIGDLKKLIAYLSDEHDLILDFFAGSGTTGHAVIAQNANDGKSRRYILAQLPEPLLSSNKEQTISAAFCLSIDKPLNIAEITKERLRRAGAKVKADNPMFAGDTGFRVFKLDTSNIRPWNPDRDDLEGSLIANLEHIQPGRSESDVLFEILLKLGLDLCVPIETRSIAGKTVHSVGGGVLLTCLDEHVKVTEVETLALGMAGWRREILHALGFTDEQMLKREDTAVFRDSAFENDVAKSNLAAILEQYGIKTVRSL